MTDLTLNDLADANRSRCKRWLGPDSEPWTGSDWSNAMCGEAGETANVVKKLRRAETGAVNAGDPDHNALLIMLGDEIADTLIYLDLLAAHYDAVVAKFNATSERFGFPERLAFHCSEPGPTGLACSDCHNAMTTSEKMADWSRDADPPAEVDA